MQRPEQLPEELVALEAYWRMRRGPQGLPQRAAFGPLELRPWLGHLAMVAVERQPQLRFRIVLSGTSMDDFRGHGATNRYIDELSSCRASSEKPFRTCLAQAAPVFFHFDNSRNSHVYPCLAKLLLPLAAADGVIERVMVGTYPARLPVARAA